MKKNELYRKNVIVTGGSGFIGKALVNRLNSLGARVLVLDSSQNVDISNWNKLKGIKIIKNCEILYHLAAKSYVPYSWTEPHIVYTNNVLSTLNILELCRLKKINKLVYMSSYIYGRPEYLPIDEAHPVSPNNPYAWSKLAGENLCRGYAMNFGLQCIILRPFNVYGPGQKEPFLIPTIMAQFFKNKKISINDLRPKRDFLYIDDLIEALISCKNYR
ncbi:MAG: SDR family oxidoreductase, partial [Candidatus Omnitrophica bacterium]|nr:SDR family oxidoreductase [Candidatus Omnitrophota bacterium]